MSTAIVGQVSASEFEPAKIELGNGFTMRPMLGAALGYDDNTTRTRGDKTDSFFSVFAPGANIGYGDQVSNATLGYRATIGTYFDSSDDDYLDHSVLAALHHEFTARHRIDLSYNFDRGHDARGTGVSEGNGENVNEPVEWDQNKVALTYGFGVPTATVNLDFNFEYDDKEYANFRDVTRFRDYDTVGGGVVVYWNVMPKTSLLIDSEVKSISYDVVEQDGVSRDSDVTRVLAGVRWEATGKTTGVAKLGYEDKDFDDSGREDFEDVSWEVGVEWTPVEYSTVEFSTGRRSKDPDTFGDYIKETSVELGWTHYWLDRFSTNLGIAYVDEQFTGIDRDDELWVTKVGATYDMKRWLQFALTYQYQDQDSDVDSIKYDRNQVLLGVKVAM
ncbi:outer membrane beta-barrel protein [Corallincola platygyrae]|uniref:Outer membrane beta-barrel protein n=1 Tax=Corallincola platygyrae TaxID=1193278 RepID=A0ABW4XKQ8_9GAMM